MVAAVGAHGGEISHVGDERRLGAGRGRRRRPGPAPCRAREAGADRDRGELARRRAACSGSSPRARKAAIAEEWVQPEPCAAPSGWRSPGISTGSSPSKKRSTRSSQWPPVTTTASGRARARRGPAPPGSRPRPARSATRASGMFGVAIVASGSSRRPARRGPRRRATGRRSRRPSPGRSRPAPRRRSPSASTTASTVAAVPSIPILTASTPMSSATTRTWATIIPANRLDRLDADRVLRRDRRDRGHPVHPTARERLQVGLDAGAAAGVRAGDREHGWYAFRSHPRQPRCRAVAPAGSSVRSRGRRRAGDVAEQLEAGEGGAGLGAGEAEAVATASQLVPRLDRGEHLGESRLERRARAVDLSRGRASRRGRPGRRGPGRRRRRAGCWAGRGARGDRAGDGPEVTAEIGGEVGGDQGARAGGRLDDDGHPGQRRHDPVAGREGPAPGRRAGRELGDHQPASRRSAARASGGPPGRRCRGRSRERRSCGRRRARRDGRRRRCRRRGR